MADHDDALNIAASALSRLVEIYVVDEAARTRTPTRMDLVSGRFMRGATEFRRNDGTSLRSMSVKRTDLTSALSLIKRVGIPFGLALEADEAERKIPSRAPRETEKKEPG